jgi:single-strand DNA-binding protein
MNRIVLVGRLESTPDLRYTSTGIPVANFSLSVRRSIPNGQGRYERDVFRVVTWRKLAETCCKFLERGRMIAVDGKLQNRVMSSPNGDKRIVVEIHADDVRFLEGAKPRGGFDNGDDMIERPDLVEKTEPQNGVVHEHAEIPQAPVTETASVDYQIDEDPWLPEEDGTPLDPGL